MKKMMKILTVLLALTCAIMPVVGCGGGGVEKNKTQLYIGNYNQGFGQAWLDAAAKRFEEQYADVSFEKGKTGVQVVIEDVEVSNNLYQSIKNSRSEVIFNEMADYFQWAKSGKVLDITDVVSGENASLEKYGDAAGVTIESKMYDSAIDYYRYNNKYYGVPFYETYIGIMYDIDMWAERGYYIKDNAGGKYTWTKNVAEAWAGQDGEKGTSDDGLPITYDDFYALCARIKNSGEIAIAWSGKSNTGYSSALLDALHADYEGREQMSLNYTLEGTATNVVDKIANGKVTVKTVEGVTAQTGYNLYRQAGRYYALNFFEHIMDGGYYSDKIFNKQTVTHLDAQNFFVIKNKFGGTSIGQDVAMLIEGTWWYNEAAGAFKSIENRGGGQRQANALRSQAIGMFRQRENARVQTVACQRIHQVRTFGRKSRRVHRNSQRAQAIQVQCFGRKTRRNDPVCAQPAQKSRKLGNGLSVFALDFVQQQAHRLFRLAQLVDQDRQRRL